MPDMIIEEAPQRPVGLFLIIRQISQWGLDLLFPPRCGNCGRVDVGWCDDCTTLLAECPLVSKLKSLSETFSVISSGVHEGILREALHNLKYLRQTQLVSLFGARLASLWVEQNRSADFITCVPMGMNRLKERGYNQADLIAQSFAYRVHIPYIPHALTRVKETISQVGLSAQERQNNMRGVFKAQSEEIRGKIGIIVDDVLTTGATLSECANALYDGGAKRVYGLTITRASDVF
ncbi:MAG: hypothetical protein CUN52_00665 [Phototrophicales bacterium]|nr:MAG: hypothetical protein CUN52_00665 [Phototrophicales bacterium]